VQIWLDPGVAAKLKALRGPGRATATSSCGWRRARRSAERHCQSLTRRSALEKPEGTAQPDETTTKRVLGGSEVRVRAARLSMVPSIAKGLDARM
jgi:hypothetical protein